jgi:hypothetical protein
VPLDWFHGKCRNQAVPTLTVTFFALCFFLRLEPFNLYRSHVRDMQFVVAMFR